MSGPAGGGGAAPQGLSEAARLSMGGGAGAGSEKTGMQHFFGRFGGHTNPFQLPSLFACFTSPLASNPLSPYGKHIRGFLGIKVSQLGLKGGYNPAPGGEGGPISPPQVQHAGGGGGHSLGA